MTGAIAKRYAKALFALARDEGALEETGEALRRLAVIAEDPEIGPQLANPLLSTKTRAALARTLTERLELGPTTGNFVGLLAINQRLDQLGGIAAHYQRLVDQELGQTRAKHSTRHRKPLSASPVGAGAGNLMYNLPHPVVGVRPGRMRNRCSWTGDDPLMIEYHDREWGVPLHDDKTIFEFLVLEGAQAGLSWMTILRKREGYRDAFDGFDFTKIAGYGDADVARLLADAGIVRNRQKIASAITNAKAFLKVRREFGSFDAYQWAFVGGKPIKNAWKSLDDIPATSAESEAMSRDMKARGFKFVGPTIVYAHMQAVGMVNDHIVDCFRYSEISG